MRIEEIPEGQIFTIWETPSYPKLKTTDGYIDMRDLIVNNAHIKYDCRVMDESEVASKFNISIEQVKKWKEDVINKIKL